MLIILAPMIMETPAAIEKNAVAEEMSRMGGMEVKSTLQHEPDPVICSVLFAIIRWPVPKKRRPLQPKGTPQIFHYESYLGKAHSGNSLSRASNAGKGAVTKIQRPACNERPTISDSDGHAPVVGGIRYEQACTEREGLMGGCKAMSIKATAICSA
jgi:hypothetical protein